MRLVSAYYSDEGPFMSSGLFNDFDTSNNPDSLTTDDCLVVWGGEDISTSLYRHINTGYTSAPDRPSKRDHVEWSMMQRAKELQIPILGICRGAQMLCALAGGYLIQHVNNHGGSHLVTTVDGQSFVTNSIHHQMQYPFDVPHQLLAWTKVRSDVHIAARNEHVVSVDMEVEPELVYYPTVKGLGIQWHPEYMSDDAEATQYIFNVMKEKWL